MKNLKVGMKVLIKKSKQVKNNEWYTIKEVLKGSYNNYLYCTKPKICIEYNNLYYWIGTSCVVEIE